MSQDKKSLFQIDGSDSVTSPIDQESKGISRRGFLKILGSASAVGVAGCADKATQNVFPLVKGDDQQIPGVAVWYSSTCGECSAGCGIRVRTREGRAVKIEGNPENPVNKGGLCALGQASLQSLYDPDRIRTPLKKVAKSLDNKSGFEPISWEDALNQVASWIKQSKLKKAFLTGETTGAIDELLNDFTSKIGSQRVTYDLLSASTVAKASEIVFGVNGVPTYKLDKADTIVNFGSDFLETWVSPCEYARGWAVSRKAKKPLRLIHIEPRLSLTGANADLWLTSKPGSEVRVALAILKLLLQKGFGSELASDVKGALIKITSSIEVTSVSEESGVPIEKLVVVSQYLADSQSPLVLCGGSAASTTSGLALNIACNGINLILGSVGKTLQIGHARSSKSSLSKMRELIALLEKGEVDLLFINETNPAFTLPSSYGFKYAAKKATHVVSFASHLDETAELADIILPSNTSLESWGDSRPLPGVHSLIQPTMTALFNTRPFGDSLIELGERSGNTVASTSGKDFLSYLKDSWRKIHSAAGSKVSAEFSKFWNESLDKGGYFVESDNNTKKADVTSKSFDQDFKVGEFSAPGTSGKDLILYPYPSVKSFDGRAANRPWLQELPDPISQASWDSWAEIHPDTAREKGIAQGDVVTLRNNLGEINVSAYLTPYVHRDIVAVPIGQGHSSYGRFARKVSGGNVLDLVPTSSDEKSEAPPIFAARAQVIRGRGKSSMVIVQGSDSQLGRGLAQSVALTAAGLPESSHEGGSHGAHAHNKPKQMYEQRKHPLYSWALTVDLSTCTGCSACVVACYAENNIPVVGKERMAEGREMSWLRIERYYEGPAEELKVDFLPMMCQQCGNAPCEPVCPVYATYHNEEGLNAMIYNRCVGTRYCSNNCSYKVRRFNWFEYEVQDTLMMQLNPDVNKRSVGVMEKCTFCVQRIVEGKDRAKDAGRKVIDGEITPACVQSCPTQALTFGDLNDPKSKVSHQVHDERAYKVLDHHLNTQPAVTYLKDIRYRT